MVSEVIQKKASTILFHLYVGSKNTKTNKQNQTKIKTENKLMVARREMGEKGEGKTIFLLFTPLLTGPVERYCTLKSIF